MATSTDVPIYTTTLVSDSASVTIDLTSYQMYTNLKLVISARRGIDNAGGAGTITFNNDSSSGLYSSTLLYTDGNAPYSYRWSSQNNLPASFSAGDSYYAANTIYIQNYASQSMHKTILSKYGWPGTNSRSATSIGTWRNTSNINTITFSAANNIKAGSTFSVYGIGTASPAKATGGAIYSDSNYWYHVFTNTAAFTPSQSLSADVLVVAGGGSGGSGYAGGGGAGGVCYQASRSVSATSYTVTVGAGGASANTGGYYAGNSGNNSVFDTITALGGGGGGAYNGASAVSGGSGGGAGMSVTNGQSLSGASATQGNSGGATGYGNAGGSSLRNNPIFLGGGGGGGGTAGGNASGSNAGAGGAGLNTWSSILSVVGLGVSGYIAGGGGGGAESGTNGAGGAGGGGAGGLYGSSSAVNGTVNTGSGGGGVGGNTATSGTGGSGVVIIRYAK